MKIIVRLEARPGKSSDVISIFSDGQGHACRPDTTCKMIYLYWSAFRAQSCEMYNVTEEDGDTVKRDGMHLTLLLQLLSYAPDFRHERLHRDLNKIKST